MFIDSIECNLTDHNLISCKFHSNLKNSFSLFKRKVNYKCKFPELSESLRVRLNCIENTGNISRDTHNLLNEISTGIKENSTRKV